MKHLRIYEIFSRPHYDFNIPEFYNAFRNIFNKEKDIEDKKSYKDFIEVGVKYRYSNGIFSFLSKYVPDWNKIPTSATIESIIKKILIDKEVEFFNDNSDIHLENREIYGRVKQVNCHTIVFSGKNVDMFVFRIGL